MQTKTTLGRTDRTHLEIKSINHSDGYIAFLIVSKDDVLQATASVAFDPSDRYEYEINNVQTYSQEVVGCVETVIENLLTFDRFSYLMGS